MEIIGLIIPAFIAGLLTFLAPCTLPLVPAYLGFISGVSGQESQSVAARRAVVLNGLAFILGFSLVFIAFGTLAGFVGSSLLPYRIWLSRIGGVFVILFGLFLVGLLKIPFLAQTKRLSIPAMFKPGKPASSLAVGLSFGFGWTPCIGPILGSILLLASTSTTSLQGAVLLAVFSAGLAVPFLAVAFGIGSAARVIDRSAKYLRLVEIIGGLFLIGLGILLLTNNVGLLIAYGFRLLEFINYDALLDYL